MILLVKLPQADFQVDTFINHLLEETKIRLDNKQNLFFVYLIFVNAILNIFKKIFRIKIYLKYFFHSSE